MMLFRRRLTEIIDRAYASGRISADDYAKAVQQIRFSRSKLAACKTVVEDMADGKDVYAGDWCEGPVIEWLKAHWLQILQAIAAILQIAILFLGETCSAAPQFSLEAIALADACRRFEGAHCCDGPPHELLMGLADDHSQYQAKVKRQGHSGFNERFELVQREIGGMAVEIAAESWDRQRDEPYHVLATEFFSCWKQSPGHWSVASRSHRFWGGSFAQGSNGIWYATILVCD